MVPRITPYGAVKEIGGSKILLEDGEKRIFFDFGKPFGRYGRFFDGVFVKQRSARGILDFLSLGILPPLRGLLRKDLIPSLTPERLIVEEIPPTGRQRKPRYLVAQSEKEIQTFWDTWAAHFPGIARDMRRENAPPVDLVFLSHAHQDHIQDLCYTDVNIPAASTAMTAFIAKVLVDVSPNSQGAPYASPYHLNKEGMLTTKGAKEILARPWVFLDSKPRGNPSEDPLDNAHAFWFTSPSKTRTYEAELTAMPAGINLRYWLVDHSIYGAAGCAVETQSGWVAYTGDLRFHGRHAQTSFTFAEELAKLQPTVLISEGTRLTTPNKTTESEVFDRCHNAAMTAGGKLIIADFAPRNVERLEIFLEIARRTDRRLLLQPRDAYLVRAMHLADPKLIGDLMEDDHLAIYTDPKSSQNRWEQIVREHYASKMISPQEVSRHPEQTILAFSLTDIADLLDLQTLKGSMLNGIYIFSNSRAYDDEQKVDFERLWNWLEYFGMQVFGLKKPYRTKEGLLIADTEPGYHASGHAGSDELVNLVRTINPKILIPVHTERPDLWQKLLTGTQINVIQPELAKPILVP